MNQVQRGCSRKVASVGAYHATHDSPKIFDDFLADALFTPEEHTQTDQDWAGLLKYIDPELGFLFLRIFSRFILRPLPIRGCPFS